jgi:hypothetical protein
MSVRRTVIWTRGSACVAERLLSLQIFLCWWMDMVLFLELEFVCCGVSLLSYRFWGPVSFVFCLFSICGFFTIGWDSCV